MARQLRTSAHPDDPPAPAGRTIPTHTAGQPVRSGQPQGDAPPADDAETTGGQAPAPPPDGPFEPDGFRYRGTEVPFGRAAKQRGLVLALWDRKKRRPRPARPIDDVITDVYGEGNDTSEAAFRQLCCEAQKKLDAANVPLRIQNLQGKVLLTERPR
jgi:hypothetical protein